MLPHLTMVVATAAASATPTPFERECLEMKRSVAEMSARVDAVLRRSEAARERDAVLEAQWAAQDTAFAKQHREFLEWFRRQQAARVKAAEKAPPPAPKKP